MHPAAKLPSAAALTTGTRALSTASRRPSSSLGFGLYDRFEKAVSWLQPPRPTPSSSTSSSMTLYQQQPLKQHLRQQSSAALFSTSSSSARSSSSSKEEEDLYQALTVSFRTRLAEQIHKPEDDYKAVIEHWTVHSNAQKDHLVRQRSRARKDRLGAAVKHKDIGWIQKEQERLEFEANGTPDDHFYVIQAYIKCGELKRATMAFEKMETMGVKLTARVLAALTRAHARAGAGSLAVAGAMVEKMREKNLQPTSIYDLSALLEYYIKMTPVTGSSASPSSSTATTTITMATRTSDPSHERVDSIWKFIEPQLQPSATPVTVNNASFSYRTYLTYLIQRAQDLDRAAELIDKMTIRDISPELERYQKTAHAVIRRLIHHGYLTEVQKLLSQKDATLAKAISPTAWGDLMDAYVARGEHQKARWTYNDMIRYEVQPSTKCKKMFSDLQLMGGTTDRGGPEVAGAGTGVEARAAASREEANILSILFNRQPKPTLS